MTTAYLFDVDGTLTPSRQSMNGSFRVTFCEFLAKYPVFLATGSDYPKTVEQVGKTITENVRRVFNCSGNDIWERGINTYTSKWVLPEIMHEWLSIKLTTSEFPLRTGLHFEHRPGTVNFSIVGRNANLDQRHQYVVWDLQKHERNDIVEEFNSLFGDTVEARAGGETGIDIFPRGKDKGQIVNHLKGYDNLVFFGDRTDPAGNDYPLAQAVRDRGGIVYQVSGWEETAKIIEAML
jgi:phosphomannomutase